MKVKGTIYKRRSHPVYDTGKKKIRDHPRQAFSRFLTHYMVCVYVSGWAGGGSVYTKSRTYGIVEEERGLYIGIERYIQAIKCLGAEMKQFQIGIVRYGVKTKGT